MPFTLAHPAAVVPLRRWLVLGAAVAGSMAPDLAYYLPPRATSTLRFPGTDVTHTLVGAVTIDALVGVLLYALWRWPIRRALLGSLPEPWATATLDRTEDVLPGRSPATRGLLVLVSSMAGALTHVVIDIFTHERPETPDVLVDDTVFGLPIASHLQRGLSAIGLALLVWWAWRELARVAPLSGWRMTAPLRAYAVVCAVLAAAATVRRLVMWSPDTINSTVVTSLLGLCWGAGVGVLAVSLVISLRRRRGARATSRDARSAPRTPDAGPRTPAVDRRATRG